jgi:hypothetical protein
MAAKTTTRVMIVLVSAPLWRFNKPMFCEEMISD